MEGLRSRINPRSTGDLAIWTFVALFFMMLSGGLAQGYLPPAQSQVQLLGTLAFVVPGLLFLALRKLTSRAMRAELETGAPGRVTVAHAITMSILGGASILVVVEYLGAPVVWFLASRLRGGEQQGLSFAQMMGVGFLALFLCGLWAGWRVGFAGSAFAMAPFALYLFINLIVSAAWPRRPNAAAVAILLANFGVAAAGGHLGSFLYRRKARRRPSAGSASPEKERSQ